MPKLSQKITEALNEQINTELASAYVYLSMSSWADEVNLPGAASWLRIQWQEELDHATKLIEYMAERGGHVRLKAIPKPPEQFNSLLDVFEQVLQHEQDVTAAIYRIYDVALQEKDFMAQGLLQWYVNEQVEEENQPAEIISMLKLAGDSGSGLLLVDRQLGERQQQGAGPRGPA